MTQTLNAYSIGHSPSIHARAVGTIVGRIRMTAEGGGIVPAADRRPIFIWRSDLRGAMPGDSVEVAILPSGNGRSKGRVVRVVERAREFLVGRIEKAGSKMRVLPLNKNIPYNFSVLPGDLGNSRHGDYVCLKIFRYPARGEEPTGCVVERLGSELDPAAARKALIAEYELPTRFSKETSAETVAISSEIPDRDLQQRLDLRDACIFTIDGEHSKDFDDAVSLRILPNGHYELGVHIADVSHFVPEGGALDREAFERGTSVYFADHSVLPMLPARLSEDLCSLVPGLDRLTFSCIMVFDRSGHRVKTHLAKSVIRSKARLTYTLADALLQSSRQDCADMSAAVGEQLRQMARLAGILRDRYLAEGRLELVDGKGSLRFDHRGRVVEIQTEKRGPSSHMIEMFMLAANVAVAEEMRGMPFIYRVHPVPESSKVLRAKTFLKARGYEWEEATGLAEVLASILRQAASIGDEQFVSRYLLRNLLSRAIYSPEPEKHFNLAFPLYTHFTSPIRRYADLAVHRLLKAKLDNRDGCPVPGAMRSNHEIAARCTERAILAKKAEREYFAWRAIEYFQGEMCESFQAFVSDLGHGEVEVTLVEHPSICGRLVEAGRVSLGQMVKVEVAEADVGQRRLAFRLITQLHEIPMVAVDEMADVARSIPVYVS